MGKAPCTPARRKRVQRLRSPTSGRFISGSRVTKTSSSQPLSSSKRVKTKAKGKRLFQETSLPLNEQPMDWDRSAPELPDTPDTAEKAEKAKSLWSLTTPNRSFWDAITSSAQAQEPLTSSSFGDDNLDAIMNRMNNSISSQLDISLTEGSNHFSSSPRSHTDPRDLLPISSAEEEDLRLAIWPTVQHMVELTSSRLHIPNPQKDYLTQLRGLLSHFTTTWQLCGHLGSPPTAFSLEAWTGPIANWRTSYYTNGDQRFPASLILSHLEPWLSSTSPSRHASPFLLEGPPSPTAENLPIARSQARRRRPALATIYDGQPNFGLPPSAAQIATYQSTNPSSSAKSFILPVSNPPGLSSHNRPVVPWKAVVGREAWRTEFPIFQDPDADVDGDAGIEEGEMEVPPTPFEESDSPMRDQENVRRNPDEMREFLEELRRGEGIGRDEDEEEDDDMMDEMLTSPSVQRVRREWERAHRDWDYEGGEGLTEMMM
ncbi:MAG: hypothetical protein Q9202_000557 [Teloschistes flavicans]